MAKVPNIRQIFAVIVIVVLIMSGCAYPIKYKLNEKNISILKQTLPLRVLVTKFSDMRNSEERIKSLRKQKGYPDYGDYTYDKQFKGEVAEAITTMLVQHLNYSRVFSQVELAPFTSEQLSEEKLTSLSQIGVDAVMTGEIQHFYGYYDTNIFREILYQIPSYLYYFINPFGFSSDFVDALIHVSIWITGTIGGLYLESLHKRDIEWRTKLSVKMIHTSTHDVLWEDTIEIFGKVHQRMPGPGGRPPRKFEVAINSLRDAVNKMVKSLSQVSLPQKLN